MSKINECRLKRFMMAGSLWLFIFCQQPQGSIETDFMQHEDAIEFKQARVLPGMLIACG
jgi:hypothetical protein